MAKNKSGSFEVTEAAVLAAIVERFHYDDRIGDRLESVVDAQVRARIGPGHETGRDPQGRPGLPLTPRNP